MNPNHSTVATVAQNNTINDNIGVDKNTCFLCHGKGHWARQCPSLPSIYLNDNAPKCYICGGIGHFARVCPSSQDAYQRETTLIDSLLFYQSYPSYLVEPMLYSLPNLLTYYGEDMISTGGAESFDDFAPRSPLGPTAGGIISHEPTEMINVMTETNEIMSDSHNIN